MAETDDWMLSDTTVAARQAERDFGLGRDHVAVRGAHYPEDDFSHDDAADRHETYTLAGPEATMPYEEDPDCDNCGHRLSDHSPASGCLDPQCSCIAFEGEVDDGH